MQKVNRVKEKFLKAFLVLGAIGILFGFAGVSAVEPNGASVSEISSERASNDTAGSHGAIAGNVTELNLVGFSTTQSWQGYFGNVSGAITLEDASDNVLYNWSLASPEGEVYASTNHTITWSNIQCFNFTATGTGEDESGNGGTTNLNGTNLSILESRFGINVSDADGVNETFTLLGSGHDTFTTANLEFSEGECPNTRVFGDTGEGVDNEFEEVLLYEPSTFSVVFASILESGSVLGFDDNDHDFEMLVLEDGHGVDSSTTTYYFFVEIE